MFQFNIEITVLLVSMLTGSAVISISIRNSEQSNRFLLVLQRSFTRNANSSMFLMPGDVRWHECVNITHLLKHLCTWGTLECSQFESGYIISLRHTKHVSMHRRINNFLGETLTGRNLLWTKPTLTNTATNMAIKVMILARMFQAM